MRRKLRVLAATWLMLQIAWLTAILPRDCCDAHRHADQSGQHSAPAAYCPMRGEDGRPCPMHRGQDQSAHHQTQSAHHQTITAEHHPSPSPRTACRIAGTCDGPMAALTVLLSTHGILPAPATTLSNVGIRLAGADVGENVVGRFESPDPPPPRA